MALTVFLPFRQGALNGPFLPPDAVVENLLVQSEITSPFRKRSGFAAPIQNHVVASVVALFHASRPAHVARLVMAVVVDTIQGQLWRWPLSHVAQERSEIAPPRLHDRNPPTAVVVEQMVARVQASRLDAFPEGIFGRAFAAVLRQQVATDFTVEATTTARDTAKQVRARDKGLITAVARAVPRDLFSLRWAANIYHQSREALAAQVAHLHALYFISGAPQKGAIL